MNYFKKALNLYAVFEGRSTRPEFWYFVLVSCIIQIILSIFDSMFGLKYTDDQGMLETIYSLAVLVPSLAVSVRRMHDINKSGWFILIPIYNIILACRAGTPGDNRFGASPQATQEASPSLPVQQ